MSLKKGMQFSVSALNEERSRITAFLQSRGFYKFNRDFIRFVADTINKGNLVNISMQLLLYRANIRSAEQQHPCYFIRNIEYTSGTEGLNVNLRPGVLDENTMLQAGKTYDGSALQRTYQRFSRLNALAYTNIQMKE